MRLVHRVINQTTKLMAQSIPSVPIKPPPPPPTSPGICRVFVRKPLPGVGHLSILLAVVQSFTYV